MQSENHVQVMERAGRYLQQQYAEHGHWEDFQSHRFGISTEWTTAYVGHSLSPSRDNKTLLREAGCYLLAQMREFGWGYGPKYFTDADSTSFAALFLQSQRLLTKTDRQGVARFLFEHQHPEC